MARKTFNAKLLDQPPRPKTGFHLLFDDKTTGFALRIPAVGSPTFQVVARNPQGKEKRVAIATWVPHGGLDMGGRKQTIDGLRSLAVAVKANIQAGRVPFFDGTSDEPEWTTLTLRQALDIHIEGKQAKGRMGARTAKNYRDTTRVHLSDWLDQPIRSISREAMRQRHIRIGETSGHAIANNTARVVSAVWNRAAKQHPELGVSPTINVDHFEVEPRDYGVREDDIPRLWKQIDGLEDDVRRDFYRTTFLTGLRRETVAVLRVQDFDQTARTLYIAKPKGGRRKAFVLPVCNQLHEILVQRARVSQDGHTPWLFPAESKSGHITEPRVDGLLPPHAFRHLYSSVAGNLVPAYPLKQLLNHGVSRRDVTAGYIKLTPAQLMVHAQRIGDHIEQLINAAAGDSK